MDSPSHSFSPVVVKEELPCESISKKCKLVNYTLTLQSLKQFSEYGAPVEGVEENNQGCTYDGAIPSKPISEIPFSITIHLFLFQWTPTTDPQISPSSEKLALARAM